MERNEGLRKILNLSAGYELFQILVGAKRGVRWLSEHHWRVGEGMTVVDVGCGPARLRSEFPEQIRYFGFDPNQNYIETARHRQKGTFHTGGMSDFLDCHGEALAGQVDLVICSGVLHHLLDTQIEEVLKGSCHLLKRGGRFAALEPTKLAKQDACSRWVISKDRGMNLLFDWEWTHLLDRHFPRTKTQVINNLLRIPYTHALLTG